MRPWLTSLVHRAGLGTILKGVYSLVLRIRRAKKILTIQDVSAEFHMDNYERRLLLSHVCQPSEQDESYFLSALIMEISEGEIALDVGANIGIHTILLAKKVGPRGRVVAVEPEKTNFKALQKNVRLNSLSNVLAYCVGLGDKRGLETMYVKDHVGMASCSMASGQGRKIGGQIRMIPGDTLFEEEALPVPNIVKVDVEGYEYLVLQGLKGTLRKDTCRLICCEIHETLCPVGTTPQDIVDYLKNLGFSEVQMMTRGSEKHVWCSKPR